MASPEGRKTAIPTPGEDGKVRPCAGVIAEPAGEGLPAPDPEDNDWLTEAFPALEQAVCNLLEELENDGTVRFDDEPVVPGDLAPAVVRGLAHLANRPAPTPEAMAGLAAELADLALQGKDWPALLTLLRLSWEKLPGTVPQDVTARALDRLKELAEEGLVPAMRLLGEAWLNGRIPGAEQADRRPDNRRRGRRWLERAWDEGGDAKAGCTLAGLLLRGLGTPVDGGTGLEFDRHEDMDQAFDLLFALGARHNPQALFLLLDFLLELPSPRAGAMVWLLLPQVIACQGESPDDPLEDRDARAGLLPGLAWHSLLPQEGTGRLQAPKLRTLAGRLLADPRFGDNPAFSFMLALLCLSGVDGNPASVPEGLILLERAAGAGLGPACATLAGIHLYGLYRLARNEDRGLAWLDRGLALHSPRCAALKGLRQLQAEGAAATRTGDMADVPDGRPTGSLPDRDGLQALLAGTGDHPLLAWARQMGDTLALAHASCCRGFALALERERCFGEEEALFAVDAPALPAGERTARRQHLEGRAFDIDKALRETVRDLYCALARARLDGDLLTVRHVLDLVQVMQDEPAGAEFAHLYELFADLGYAGLADIPLEQGYGNNGYRDMLARLEALARVLGDGDGDEWPEE